MKVNIDWYIVENSFLFRTNLDEVHINTLYKHNCIFSSCSYQSGKDKGEVVYEGMENILTQIPWGGGRVGYFDKSGMGF